MQKFRYTPKLELLVHTVYLNKEYSNLHNKPFLVVLVCTYVYSAYYTFHDYHIYTFEYKVWFYMWNNKLCMPHY